MAAAGGMEQSRAELLADFQGITEIEDVGLAISHLNEANWDLSCAVNRALAPDVPNKSHNQHMTSNSSDVDVEMIDSDLSIIGGSVPYDRPRDQDRNRTLLEPSTSFSKEKSKKMIELRVHYLDKIYDFKMSEASTIGDLRKRIRDLSGVQQCQQILSGINNKNCYNITSTITLGSLNLCDKTIINMTVPPEYRDEGIADRLAQKYTLNIICENVDKKSYKLQFGGDSTVLHIKEAIYNLTNIPVRDQVWVGWPKSTSDSDMLAMSRITFPEHDFTVKKNIQKMHNERKRNTDDDDDDDDSTDDEDDDVVPEDEEMEEVTEYLCKKNEPLIPNNVEDEIIGCIQFAERFKERYGPSVPLFFQGSLNDAVQEACNKPAKDRKLLGIYLHHENSISSNIFCSKLLTCDFVLSVLATNFVIYGWDLTDIANEKMLLSSVSNALSMDVCRTIKDIPKPRLPVLIIIMKIRSKIEIYSVINGGVSPEEFNRLLDENVAVWTSRRDEEIAEEEERAAREKIKKEQDDAYKESLEADRAKEELKKQLEIIEKDNKERVEIERLEAEAKQTAEQNAARRRLPIEPESEAGDSITKIQFRLPDNRTICRRFTIDTPLASLIDFLIVEGYSPEAFKIIGCWPRKDLADEDSEKTLYDLKLINENVLVKERSNE